MPSRSKKVVAWSPWEPKSPLERLGRENHRRGMGHLLARSREGLPVGDAQGRVYNGKWAVEAVWDRPFLADDRF